MIDDELRSLEVAWRAESSFELWSRWARLLRRTGEDRPFRLLRTAERIVGLDRRMERLDEHAYSLRAIDPERARSFDKLENWIRTRHRARLANRLSRFFGFCLDLGYPPPVDGAWSEHREWTGTPAEGRVAPRSDPRWRLLPATGSPVAIELNQARGSLLRRRKDRIPIRRSRFGSS